MKEKIINAVIFLAIGALLASIVYFKSCNKKVIPPTVTSEVVKVEAIKVAVLVNNDSIQNVALKQEVENLYKQIDFVEQNEINATNSSEKLKLKLAAKENVIIKEPRPTLEDKEDYFASVDTLQKFYDARIEAKEMINDNLQKVIVIKDVEINNKQILADLLRQSFDKSTQQNILLVDSNSIKNGIIAKQKFKIIAKRKENWIWRIAFTTGAYFFIKNNTK